MRVKLFPYDSFIIKTSDPLPVVVKRLTACVESPRSFQWFVPRHHAPYQGTISETGFEISRIINYRNSFLPIIRGEFEQQPSGTLVRVKMGLHPFVTVFLAFWYLTWYSFTIPICFSGIMPIEMAVVFLGMPTAILVIFWYAFWYEANRSHNELIEIIQGRKGEWQTYNNSQQRTFKAVQWGLWLIFMALFSWQVISTKFFPPTETESSSSIETVSCSENSTRSPGCNFEVVRTLTGHPAASRLALSADGQTLVSGGIDKAIKVWDLKTGQLKKTFQSDSGKILAVAIAPDGKTIVSGSADRMVRIWKLTGEQKPLVLSGHREDVNFVGITIDGKAIVSGSYNEIKVWNLATGKLIATLPNQPKSELKIGPISVIDDSAEHFRLLAIDINSDTAILDFYNSVKVWDLTTNQPKATLNERFDAFAGSVLSAYISPDGKLAALQYTNSAKKFETRLKVWDLNTGKVKAEGTTFFSRDTFINIPLALSRDRIFASSQGELKIWNLETAQLETVVKADWMSYLVVSPDGKLLVGVVGDPYTQPTQIKVWRRP